MEFSGERSLPVSCEAAWEALNDTALLKDAIPGCESIAPAATDAAGRPNRYDVVMIAAVGPVKARFRGRLELADLDPPHAYTLRFEGGGGATSGRGSAAVRLVAVDASTTTLDYQATASIGGRAGFGSRLVELAVRRITGAFFDNFAKALKERRR